MPLNDAGIPTAPPWSPPVATSTAPDATRAALPLDDPPVVRVRSHGFSTGPVREVCEPPEKQRSSQTAFPVIVAPAASIRLTIVASRAGTYPSNVAEPFIIGTPATAVLSLTATVRPASGPPALPVTSQVTYQAPSGLSAAPGRLQARCGTAGSTSACNRSTMSQDRSTPCTAGMKDATSASGRPRP